MDRNGDDELLDDRHARRWRKRVGSVGVALASIAEDLNVLQKLDDAHRARKKERVETHVAEIGETISEYSRILSEAIHLFEDHPCMSEAEKRRLQPVLIGELGKIMLVRFYLAEILGILP